MLLYICVCVLGVVLGGREDKTKGFLEPGTRAPSARHGLSAFPRLGKNEF